MTENGVAGFSFEVGGGASQGSCEALGRSVEVIDRETLLELEVGRDVVPEDAREEHEAEFAARDEPDDRDHGREEGEEDEVTIGDQQAKDGLVDTRDEQA